MSMRARMTMRAMCYCKMRATCHRKMRATCSQRVGSLQSKPRMRENFVQPLAIGFQANQEMQGRKTEREIQHEAISHGYAKFKRRATTGEI